MAWNQQGNRIDVSRHYLSGEGAAMAYGALAPLAPLTDTLWGPGSASPSSLRFFISRDANWHLFASGGGVSSASAVCDIVHAWRRDRGVAISGPAPETVLTGGNYRAMAMDWGHGKDGNAILGVWDADTHDWEVTGISSSNGVSGWTASALQPLALDCMPLAGLARDRDGCYWFAYSDYSAAGTGVFRVKRAKSLKSDGTGVWSSVAVPVPAMAEPASEVGLPGTCNVIGADVHVLRQGLLLFTIFHWFDFSIGGFRFLCSRLVATYDDVDPEVLTWSNLKFQPGFDYQILRTGIPSALDEPSDFPDALTRGAWPAFGIFQGRDGRVDWAYRTAGGTISTNKWKKIAKDGTAS